MTQRLWHENQILKALGAGATVVAASERLARSARLAHADAARERGARVWERPAVLTWTAFLHDQYSRVEELALQPGPRLLVPHQAETLWETLIRDAHDESALLQPAATARAASAAWAACLAYDISLAELTQEAAGDDAHQFALWGRAYSEHCEAQGLLDPARLPDFLEGKFTAGEATPPQHCLCIGFQEFTPQQQRLLDALRAAGSRVEQSPVAGERDSICRRIVCPDAQAEIEAAARWARALLEATPALRIAIVVRDLSEQRQAITRTLDRILCPGVPADCTARPYNLSLGQAFTDCPVVSDALIVLQCLRWRLPFAQVSRLLRSPFLAAADSESAARARLETRLRDANQDQVGLNRLLALAQKGGETRAFHSMLEAVLKLQQVTPGRQLPSEWSKTFAALLKTCGWPGQRTPDTDEYQTVKVLRESLSEFAQLDAALPAIDAGDALTRFMGLVSRREFQPASADVPLQVLGMPETAGLQFDHLWIMGLTDAVWPPSPRPDPFIPWTLQRRHQLPHASAARELEYASQVTARLLNSAPDVMVSTPERDADTELRPSPLLAEIELAAEAKVPQSSVQDWRVRLQQDATIALSEFIDDRGPPLAQAGIVAGGTQLLQAQAACPFRSFALYRLGAQQVTTPSPGLSAMERGSMLHEVLAHLWERLRNYATLKGLQASERTQLLGDSVAQVVNRFAARDPDVFTPNFKRLEQERLTRLIVVWLDIEAARSPFVVEEREQSHPVTLGRLAFNTRVDRVDRLPEGDRVLIDYKSGAADPRKWLGERPDEPQLPIYAVSDPQPPAAVLFAQLSTGDLRYRGFAERDGLAPDIGAYAAGKQPDAPQDWPALLSHWRATVTALADEFADGEARVDPKHHADTCRCCHLQALCRIHERDGLSMEDADAQE
ncbi:MAG TPA: PD-(D/E)XK nuclease family protein [Gammaproteobacteria bacterium]|nr:PD-(D/E)XK nuclease family protein [Gammaproteobacteria bacterium]